MVAYFVRRRRSLTISTVFLISVKASRIHDPAFRWTGRNQLNGSRRCGELESATGSVYAAWSAAVIYMRRGALLCA